jgi:cysteinyl-tRNA synthetase
VEVLEPLYDDLNTPRALAALTAHARALARAGDEDERARLSAELRAAADLLGLLQHRPEDWFAREAAGLDAEAVEALIAERAAAREQRDFARADRIRDQLEAMDVLIEDGADGTTWRLRH